MEGPKGVESNSDPEDTGVPKPKEKQRAGEGTAVGTQSTPPSPSCNGKPDLP